MSVPRFLSYAYRYLSNAAVTDVQQIIDDLVTELTANGWTVTAGGTGLTPTTFLSPARSDIIRMSLTATRVSATQVTFAPFDHNGVAIYSAQQLNISGTTAVHYCTGALWCYVFSGVATWQSFLTGIYDNAPHDLDKPYPGYFASCAMAAHTDLDQYSNWYRAGNNYSPVGAYSRRHNDWTANMVFVTLSGANMFAPMDVVDYWDGFLLGRLPQIVLIDRNLAVGTDLTVPIDTGVNATFKVAMTSGSYHKYAFRKA